MALRSAKLFTPKRADKLQIIRTTFLSSLIVFMLVFGLWPEEIKTLNVTRQGNLLQVPVSQKVQPQETQPVEPMKVTQKTFPPERSGEAPQKISAVIKATLPPVVPTEEQVAGMAPAKKSTAVPNQSEVKASTAEVPVLESVEVVDEEAMSELQPVYSPGFIDKRVEPPEYLGDIITAPGENFGDMVRRIYGPWSFNPENTKTVLAVNPDIKSPELLNVGDKIRFPTIPVTLTPKAEEVWWVRIITFDNIQSAYRYLRKYRKSSPPLVIIPSRDDSGQVLMNILLEEYFMAKESAQKAINALPALIKPQTEALHGLSPATFYYRMKQNDEKYNETKKQ